MTDERPTHAGAANMPPFPRASNPDPARRDDQPEPGPSAPGAEPSAESEAAPDAAAPVADATQPEPPNGSASAPGPDLDTPADLNAAAMEHDPDATREDELDRDVEPDDSDEAGWFADEDEGLDAESAYEADDDLDEQDLDDSAGAGSFRATVTSELARRAELSVLKGMEHVAETFEQTADRIHRLAHLRGGPEALTLGPVHSTVGWLEGAADYLRSSDLEGVQTDLRQRVRARPVQSLGIALCAGWVIGRILR